MATPEITRCQGKMFKKAIALISVLSGFAADDKVGARRIGRLRTRIWRCKGNPNGKLPLGVTGGDLVLDTQNSKVYRFISGATYVDITAVA